MNDLKIAILALCLFAIVVPGQCQVAAPTISFKKEKFDFGKVKQGKKVKYSFVFENTGDMPVIIKEVKSSCGCISVDYSEEYVQPGESGEIQMKLKTNGKSGSFKKKITVYGNMDPPTFTLIVTGKIKDTEEKEKKKKEKAKEKKKDKKEKKKEKQKKKD